MTGQQEEAVCGQGILSEEYRDYIFQRGNLQLLENVPKDQLCRVEAGRFECVYVPKEYAEEISEVSLPYSATPKCFALLDLETLNQSGISTIQNYPGLELKGEGVLIGFVDTGIDYQNNIFRNLDGSTRIVALWDQTGEGGVAPMAFPYGREYQREELNQALAGENPFEQVPVTDTIGHGTFLASVAAGGANVQEGFLGAAPESELAVVKLKEAKDYLRTWNWIREDTPCYQETDILLGIAYLLEIARREGKPMVICLALGSNQGSRTGSLPLSLFLSESAGRNLGIVVGGGNEGNQRHHYRGQLQSLTDVREIEFRVEQEMAGFVMELWTDVPNILGVSLLSPSGEKISLTPILRNSSGTYRFILEKTTVYVNYRLLVENTGSELIYFRFNNPTGGLWKLLVEGVSLADGIFDIWLPIKAFLAEDVYFLESNPDTTITSPGAAKEVVTVGFYNGSNGSLGLSSGRGYSRSESVKPELVAAGVQVLGLGTDGRFVRREGSSIASGILAGAMALLLEWSVKDTREQGIYNSQLKSLLILGANRESGREYPNREWGYGTLNLYQVFEVIRNL